MNLPFLNNNIFLIEDSTPSADKERGKRKLLIILQKDEAENTNLKTFLGKIIASIKYEPSTDVYLYPLDSEKKYSLALLQLSLPSEFVFVFGLEAKQLGIQAQFKKYVLTEIGQTAYLFCDNLTEVEKHTPLKAALWDAIKNTIK